MTTTYRVALPDGGVTTRKSGRVYTHAVVGLVDGEWATLAYAGTEELAHKRMASDFGWAADRRVVPVTVDESRTAKQTRELARHNLHDVMAKARNDLLAYDHELAEAMTHEIDQCHKRWGWR